jgi:hypothetical protein
MLVKAEILIAGNNVTDFPEMKSLKRTMVRDMMTSVAEVLVIQ